MNKISKYISILPILLLVGCSAFKQTTPIKVEVDNTNLTKFVKAHPVPVPTERSVKGMTETVNVALYRQCVLNDYLGLDVPSYCTNTMPKLRTLKL